MCKEIKHKHKHVLISLWFSIQTRIWSVRMTINECVYLRELWCYFLEITWSLKMSIIKIQYMQSKLKSGCTLCRKLGRGGWRFWVQSRRGYVSDSYSNILSDSLSHSKCMSDSLSHSKWMSDLQLTHELLKQYSQLKKESYSNNPSMSHSFIVSNLMSRSHCTQWPRSYSVKTLLTINF